MLFSVSGAIASSSNFLLGVSYSEWLSSIRTEQIATDSSGALYILSAAFGAPSSVTKLSADGKTMVWQNQLGFVANQMAVDSNGGIYVVPEVQPGATVSVAKLGASGTGFAWTTPVGFTAIAQPVVAVDSQGRAYVAAENRVNNYITETAFVARVNAAGTGVDYTAQVMGIPSSIAVEQTGAAYIAGTATNAQGVGTGFLARVAPDGSAGYYSVFIYGDSQTVAVDASGNVVVFGAGTIKHVDSTGAVTLSIPVGSGAGTSVALDAAGNIYVGGSSQGIAPMKNRLATCASQNTPTQMLMVIAPDGSTLQTTYIPGSDYQGGSPLVATGPNSVFVVGTAGPSFAPSQTGPFPAGAAGGNFLSSFSQNPGATTYPLACLANAASLAVGSVAPGELVALFGNGLGPQQGVQASAQTAFPTAFPKTAADVEVTFDGLAAPLLYVQDAQINAVVPWALTPGQNTQICVSYGDAKTNCLTWPVAQTSPAVFKVDGVYAAALNQDGTVNSAKNPAPVGSIVSVFATGLGPITPPLADGTLVGMPLAKNVLTVGVQASYSIGIPFGTPVNVPFAVSYEGPAPSMVAGISQINFQVSSFPSYGAIYLSVGSIFSPGFEVHIAGQ